ncbi:MAG TPA: histidinol-phosphate transaminase [Gammaproteobacteria bacterium]|nr:histidinol-phosphate transaminase [Gammaproteobacteria bacterium]
MQLLIPERVRLGAVYHVQDATGMIKLDAMENPFVWPSCLRAQYAERIAKCSLNRYPDPYASAVRVPLRQWMGIPETLDILFGNGSDEIIALLISSLIGSGRSVCAPDPSFVMFKVLADQYSVAFRALPLDSSFDIDLDGWLACLRKTDPAVIFVPQPNNPTGNLFSRERLAKIVESTQALVVIDEAYTAFTDADFLDWSVTYPNVLVMRTLSKVGLAGSRFGMLVGHPAWISELDKMRLPYNINVLSQTAVQFALEHAQILEEQSYCIRKERTKLTHELEKRGFNVWPSEANFVVVKCEVDKARPIFEALKLRQILVKCLDGSHPRLKDTLRITVGSSEEINTLLTAIDQLVAELGL